MDKIFVGGRIFTSNPAMPYASAMVVRDGRIVWVGDESDVGAVQGERIHLGGQRVLPGLIDAHMHPRDLAHSIHQIAVTPPDIYSIEDLKRAIRQRIQNGLQHDKSTQNAGLHSGHGDELPWIRGWAYDEGKLSEGRTPTRFDLDEVAPHIPVAVVRACEHMVVVNSKALELMGVNENTPNPPGGEIVRDADGRLTGLLKENARDLAYRVMPQSTVEDEAEALAKLSTKLLSQGITAVTDMMSRLSPDDYAIYERAREQGFRQRTVLYAMWDEVKGSSTASGFRFDPMHLNLHTDIRIGGLKVFADGSVSGRTAWVNPAFLRNPGDPEAFGMPLTTREELLAAAECARLNGIQLAVHAMGEQAIDLVVDTLSEVPGWIAEGPSVRVEHAALPTASAIRKAAAAGIPFVTQPIFTFAEIESYLLNLGLERTKKSYPLKTAMSQRVDVVLSSDAPATAWADPSNPFITLQSAVTRSAYNGVDIGQQERLDIATAIELHTREAQRVTRIPNVGQLREGYWADFIVLSDDILEIPATDIGKVRVQQTYMAGELVWGG